MKCKICGKEFDASHYVDSWANQMTAHQMCHSCNFWRNMLREDSERPSHTWCMINGTHYVIGDEKDSSCFRGFGGAEFVIQFNDGVVVKTTNLWCQGEPDGYWKEKFPDNAKFMDNKKWTDINGTKYLI